ncbi:ABC transporter permease subunit [Candidatus Saccharibacteria bacterium]|nr:ABC transporter permease subunit [Candidatus Saccharibacteria bacterium]
MAVYGVVGIFLVVPAIKQIFNRDSGFTFLAAVIVLSVMVLPTIVSMTVASLNAVPSTYMEASLALGVTKESSVLRVLIPAARSGIMTGVMLGVGRAIGEAMAIILVAGNAVQFPQLLEPVRFLTTGVVLEMGYAEGLHMDALFSIGFVLFVFILLINSAFKYFIRKAGAKFE